MTLIPISESAFARSPIPSIIVSAVIFTVLAEQTGTYKYHIFS